MASLPPNLPATYVEHMTTGDWAAAFFVGAGLFGPVVIFVGWYLIIRGFTLLRHHSGGLGMVLFGMLLFASPGLLIWSHEGAVQQRKIEQFYTDCLRWNDPNGPDDGIRPDDMKACPPDGQNPLRVDYQSTTVPIDPNMPDLYRQHVIADPNRPQHYFLRP